MAITEIDGYMLRKMMISCSNILQENKKRLNELNVFPVPDGDTGTNMAMTVLVAATEAEKLNTKSIKDVAKAVSSGSLRGARGNSGVILSQLFRGFSAEFDGKETADTDDLAAALANASLVAQKAVMKPKEGTILTVARDIGEKAMELSLEIDDVEAFFKEVITYGYKSLERTKEILPELKAADVVDSGGLGYLLILEGMYKALSSVDDIALGKSTKSESATIVGTHTNVDIKYGYCTEFFINLDTVTIPEFTGLTEIEDNLKKYLSKIGDSIVAVSDEDIIKIHVHTNNPGSALEYALKIGELSQIKIDNMRIQHEHLEYKSSKTTGEVTSEVAHETVNENINEAVDAVEKQDETDESKPMGIVSFSTGDGIYKLFRDLGVDYVIRGGQTMNPSTDDILTACEKVNSDTVVVLPNNKNIILATEQAAKLCQTKKIILIPTMTTPQGITAMLNFASKDSLTSLDGFDKEEFIKDNIVNMQEAINNVQSAEVTLAVRDINIDGIEIKTGDALCLLENNIVDRADTVSEAVVKLVAEMNAKNDVSIVTIYYGSDVKGEDAKLLIENLEGIYSDIEFESYDGGQDVYNYIISAE